MNKMDHILKNFINPDVKVINKTDDIINKALCFIYKGSDCVKPDTIDTVLIEAIKKTIEEEVKNEEVKKVIKKNKKLDFILVYEAPPFDIDITTSDFDIENYFENKYFTGEKADTPWRTQPLKAFELNKLNHVNKVKQDKQLFILDILPVPLPISSDLRIKWSTDHQYIINEKQLPVFLFELAIDKMLSLGLEVHQNTKFAFGMPVNTSLSIFQYYSDKPLRICTNNTNQKVCNDESCTHDSCFEFDLAQTNDRMTWKIRNKPKVKYPLHKANVNNGQHPDSELIRNAFDL